MAGPVEHGNVHDKQGKSHDENPANPKFLGCAVTMLANGLITFDTVADHLKDQRYKQEDTRTNQDWNFVGVRKVVECYEGPRKANLASSAHDRRNHWQAAAKNVG